MMLVKEREEEIVTLDLAWMFQQSASRNGAPASNHTDNVIEVDFVRLSGANRRSVDEIQWHTPKPRRRAYWLELRWYDIAMALFFIAIAIAVVRCMLELS